LILIFRKRRALLDAIKESTEELATARDVAIDFFRDPDGSWNPQQQREWKKQRDAQREKTKTTRGAENFSIFSHTMNRGGQIFLAQIRNDFLRFGNSVKMENFKPVEPPQPSGLRNAKRALIVVDDNVCCVTAFHAIKYRRHWRPVQSHCLESPLD
jgi:hypothetical protein